VQSRESIPLVSLYGVWRHACDCAFDSSDGVLTSDI